MRSYFPSPGFRKNLLIAQRAEAEGYWIDITTGDVYDSAGTERRLHYQLDGAPWVSLRLPGIDYNRPWHKVRVHVLMAYAKFGSEAFRNGLEIIHLDDDKSNNSYDNISYGTHSQAKLNPPEGLRKERADIARKTIRVITDEQVLQIKRELQERANEMGIGKQLAKKYGTSVMTISNIKTGKSHPELILPRSPGVKLKKVLTNEQREEVRAAKICSQTTIKSLAEKFEISAGHVYAIRAGNHEHKTKKE